MAPNDPHAPWQSRERGDLAPLRRMLVLLIPKQPYADWVRGTDNDPTYALQEDDRTSFLMPTVSWAPDEGREFIERYWGNFFAQMLSERDTSGAHWPKQRTLALFDQWFEVQWCGMVLDLGGYED